MFSLIIVLISIVLVTALAVATVYYGGTALTDSGAAAQAARLQNEGSQISAAAALHRVERGQFAADIGVLITNGYLRGEPSLNWSVYEDTAVATGLSEDQCRDLNAKAGVTGVPLCTAPEVQNRTLCCEQPS